PIGLALGEGAGVLGGFTPHVGGEGLAEQGPVSGGEPAADAVALLGWGEDEVFFRGVGAPGAVGAFGVGFDRPTLGDLRKPGGIDSLGWSTKYRSPRSGSAKRSSRAGDLVHSRARTWA